MSLRKSPTGRFDKIGESGHRKTDGAARVISLVKLTTSVNLRIAHHHIKQNGDWHIQTATEMYPTESSFRQCKAHKHIDARCQ